MKKKKYQKYQIFVHLYHQNVFIFNQKKIQILIKKTPPIKDSYSFSPIFNETIKDQLTLQKMKTKQKRQIETSLTKIHGIELSKRNEYNSSPTKSLRKIFFFFLTM